MVSQVVETGCKARDWSKYNQSLVNRGDITLWFADDLIESWNHENGEPKVGRPFTYSDSTIECLLMIREFFRLPYRQTEGLGKALLKLAAIDVKVPDFTSLAKRAANFDVTIRVAKAKGPIDIVVDSTGLKVFGEGEWKVTGSSVAGLNPFPFSVKTCSSVGPLMSLTISRYFRSASRSCPSTGPM